MIIDEGIRLHNITCCIIYQSPNEVGVYYNGGDSGHYHKHIYVVEGVIDAYVSDTPDPADAVFHKTHTAGVLDDISDTKGKYIIGKTYDTGALSVNFNPTPSNLVFDVQVVKDSQSVLIQNDNNIRTTVLCIKGIFTIKDKVVNSLNYVNLLPGKSETIILKDGDICAIITQPNILTVSE